MNVNKKKIGKGLVFFLLIIGAMVVSVAFLSRQSEKPNVKGGIISEGIIPGYTEEQIKEILQRKADESTFSFEINSRPIFKNGSAEGNLRIANPPYNKYSIEVDMTLDSDGKNIFKSGRIAPKHYIEYAKLTKKLKAGEYNATATISAYDTESGEFKGKSTAKLVIKVEN